MRSLVLFGIATAILSSPAPAAGKPETDEERAVAAVKRLGGQVQRDEDAPGMPVVAVVLRSTEVTDANLACLKGLRRLKALHLDSTGVTDEGLKHLRGMTEMWGCTWAGHGSPTRAWSTWPRCTSWASWN